jgi:hypothetical protein
MLQLLRLLRLKMHLSLKRHRQRKSRLSKLHPLPKRHQ